MNTLYLAREDFRTDLHPRLWEEICEQFGFEPTRDCDDYPETLELVVKKARDGDLFDGTWKDQ